MICNRHKRYKALTRPSRDCLKCWDGFFAHNPKFFGETKYLIETHGILQTEAIAGALYMKHFLRLAYMETA